jgi:hypothetical protein
MSSVIVNDLDLLRSLIRPSEHDPPLIIYPDRMPARQVTSQGFQAVSRRCRKVAEHSGVIELYQLATSQPGYICRKSFGTRRCSKISSASAPQKPLIIAGYVSRHDTQSKIRYSPSGVKFAMVHP